MADETQPATAPRTRLRRRLVWLLAVLALLGVSGAVLFATQPGQRALAAAATHLLRDPDGGGPAVERVVFTAPGRIRLIGASLDDRAGTWATAPEIVIVWHPSALLRGALAVDSIEAPSVTVLRRPVPAPERKDSGTTLSDLVPPPIGSVTVDSLALDPAVIGYAARLRVDGRFTRAPARGLAATLTVERTDQPGDRIAATARYRESVGELQLAVKVSGAAGGVLSRLAGLPGAPAIALDLDGSGSAADWRGALNARLDGTPVLQSDIGIRVAPEGELTLQAGGRMQPAKLLPGGVPAALRGPATFAVELSGAPEPARIGIRRARFENAALRLEVGDGRLDLGTSEIAATAALALLQTGWLSELAGGRAALAGAEGSVTIDGTLAAPRLAADLALTAPRLADMSAPAGRLLLEVGTSGGELKASLTLDQPRHADAIVAALLGSRAAATARARLDADGGRARDIAATLTTDLIAVTAASEDIGLADGSGTIAVTAAVDDLAPLARAAAVPVRGAARIEASVRLDGAGGIEADIGAETDGVRSDVKPLDELLGRRPSLRARIVLRPDRPLVLSGVTLVGRSFEATGEAEIDPRQNTLGAEYNVELGDFVALAASAGVPLGGRLSVAGTARGKLAAPTLALSFRAARLAWFDQELGALAGTARLTPDGVAARGALSLDYASPQGAVAAELAFRPEGAAIRLTRISLTGLGLRLAGAATVPLAGGTITAELSGSAADLAALSPLAGTELAGAATLRAKVALRGGQQTARLEIESRNLRAAGAVSARTLSCVVDAESLSGPAPRGRAVCTAEDFSPGGGPAFRSIRLTASGTPAAADVTLGLVNPAPRALRLEIAGRVERGRDSLGILLSRAEGTAAGHEVALDAPARLTVAGDRIMLGATTLRFGDGRIALEGAVRRGSVEAELRAAGLPLAALAALDPRYPVSGKLDAEARLTVSAAGANGDFTLDLTGVSLDKAVGVDVPPIAGKLTGRLADGVLVARADISGLTKTRLAADVRVPIVLSAAPLRARLPPEAPVAGTVRWQGDLSEIDRLVNVTGHSFAGAAALDAQLSGTVAAPHLAGRLTVTAGRYEQLVAGVVLRNVAVDLEADGRRIVLRRLEADDGGQGKLRVTGTIEVAPAKDFPLALDIALDRVVLVRRDDVTMALTGRLAVTGTPRDLAVKGRIEPNYVEANIARPLPAGVVELPVDEVGGTAPRPVIPGQTDEAKAPGRIALDIDLHMPRRLYVRGRGLDSEWRGDLKLFGTAEAPRIDGKLEPVRGRFDFVGKPFVLQRGTVTFAGAEPPNPALDVTAEHSARTLKAVVTLSGSASKPAIRLSSIPARPRDEILANVLFDKGAGQLSPLEAAQLASATASMTGLGGGGVDIFGLVRRTLGLSVVRAGTTSDGAPTVAVGKYLTDEVYVGAEQGAGPGTGSVQVEVEVLPNVSVRSEMGANAESKTSVQWKWDY